jgi:predicted lipoprotein with Yx(FWY)xxD motif
VRLHVCPKMNVSTISLVFMSMDALGRSAITKEQGPEPRRGAGCCTLRRRSGVLAVATIAALALAACGGAASPTTTTTTSMPPTSSPSTSFSTANVTGLGTVLVDGSGRTVYELSSPATKNLPCTAASGCTSAWIPLPLPAGSAGATATGGATSSLLSTISVGTTTYPTYNGWVLYEFTGDTGPGQANGQGLSSFGGTWRAIDASGVPVTSSPSTGTTSTTYNY